MRVSAWVSGLSAQPLYHIFPEQKKNKLGDAQIRRTPLKFTTIKVPVGNKPDALAHKIEKLGETMDIKTIASMVWHPHGAVVIVGYEEKPQSKKAPSTRKAKKAEIAETSSGEQHGSHQPASTDLPD